MATRRTSQEGSISKDDEQYEYNVFEPEDKYWCADPFLLEKDNKIYVFCECFVKEKNKGTIAVAEFKEEKICDLRIVIEQKYHMSYPCVFEHNNCCYMIPETCDNHTIELYRAMEFPDSWILDTVLKKDIRCVDATVFLKENKFYVIGYESKGKNSKLLIFNLDMDYKTLKAYAEMEAGNTKRPAGNLFNICNRIIRPSQDCTKKYGEQIIMNEIVSFEKNNYQEKKFCKYRCENIKFKGNYKADRIHTINRVNGVEIIDLSQDKFDLLRGFKIFKSKVIKH